MTTRAKRAEPDLPLFPMPLHRRTSKAQGPAHAPAGTVDTRGEARKSLGDHAQRMEDQILEYIRRRGVLGCTDEQIAVALGLRESTARARRVEMRDAGTIVESGTPERIR